MAQATATVRKRSPIRNILLGIAAALVVVAAGAVGVWTTRCPCDTFPGFMLLGDVQREPIRDWTFANDVPICQIQVSAYGLPLGRGFGSLFGLTFFIRSTIFSPSST